MIEGDLESFENMRPFFGLSEFEGGPPHHDFASMLEEMMQNLLEREDLRAIVHQRQHDDAEGRLELGMFIQIIQHHQGDFIPLQFDNHPNPFTIR